jgi:protein-disulfide isomerase
MTVTEKQKKDAPLSSKQSAKQRREAARRRQQQNQRLLIGIVVGAIVVAGIIAVILNNLPIGDVTIPTNVGRDYVGIVDQEGYTGVTAEGFAYIGNPNAPVTVEEFASFSCPHCSTYAQSVFHGVLDKVKAGQLKWVYVPLPGYGGFDSTEATRGALCAGEQGKFWEMHDILFSWQTTYASGMNDRRRLAAGAEKLGLDMNKFNACLGSNNSSAVFDAANALATARGVQGTPTVFVDGTSLTTDTAPTLDILRGYIESKAGVLAQ